MNAKIAVGVGYVFAIVNADDIKNISLKPQNVLVSVGTDIYPLYKAETFQESRKVDTLMDTGIETYDIDEHLVKE